MEKEPEKGNHGRVKGKRRRRCPHCGHLRYDVKKRPDYFVRDVENEPNAEWVVCDHCDYQSCMDI